MVGIERCDWGAKRFNAVAGKAGDLIVEKQTGSKIKAIFAQETDHLFRKPGSKQFGDPVEGS